MLLFGLGAGFSPIGCQQRPLDVAPDRSHGTWQTIQADYDLTLKVITGISAVEMYALESSGRILFHDGGGWSYMDESPRERPLGIRAFSSSGVYAWGEFSLFHLENGSWTEIYESSGGRIRDVWASSTGDIHLSIYDGIVHFDGSNWTWLPEMSDFDVFEFWGNSSIDIYAVGNSGLIAHYDGVEWTVLQNAQSYYFADVWGSGSTDVYASTPTALIHFDGVEWRWETLPGGIRYIKDIWGTSEDNVYLIYGEGGIAHYGGTEWEVVSSSTGMPLNSIWGSSPDDIYAAGKYGKIVHFDGAEWRSLPGGRLDDPQFIWGIDDRNIYIGNTEGIFHFDGTEFNELPNVAGGLETKDLWGISPDDLTSVGNHGKVFHFDGTRWTRTATPTSRNLHAVSGSRDGSMVAAGDERTVLFRDGVRWAVMYEEVGGRAFKDIWMLSRNEWFVAGEGGIIGHYANGIWDMDRLNNWEVYSLWGTSSTDMFAGGWKTLYHFNGTVWEEMPYPEHIGTYHTSVEFQPLTGTSPSNVFVTDGFVGLFHFDGNVWSPVPSSPAEAFQSIWLSPANRLYAIDDYNADLYIYSE